MKIEQIMTRDVTTCTAGMSLDDAAGRMLLHDCGSLPVIEPRGRTVVGMITDRDICIGAHRTKKGLSDMRVEDAMTKEVETCRADQDLADAEQSMRQARVRRVPVVDGEGRLEGLVSLAQIALAAVKTQEADVRSADVGRTLASICDPS